MSSHSLLRLLQLLLLGSSFTSLVHLAWIPTLNRFKINDKKWVCAMRKKGSDDAPKANPSKGLPDSSSPLGRYYRWLLDDPTHKDYWAARTTDRTATERSRDKEED